VIAKNEIIHITEAPYVLIDDRSALLLFEHLAGAREVQVARSARVFDGPPAVGVEGVSGRRAVEV
jgi:hypothetical protein